MKRSNFPVTLPVLMLLFLFIATSCDEQEEAVISPELSISLEVRSPSEIVVSFQIISLGNQGKRETGIAWSQFTNPSVNDAGSNFQAFIDSGVAMSIKSLNAGTTYYFRGYFIDEKNNITYSPEVSAITTTPEVTSFSPESGSSGTIITIVGSNLAGGIITFDGIKADVVHGAPLKVKVPSGVTSYKIKIAIEAGGVLVTAPGDFTYLKGTWTRVKDVPIYQTYYPGFSINGYGYAGFGSKSGSDFWNYSPASDTWNNVADYPGSEKARQSAFIIGGKAYIVTSQREVWCYNPVDNTWGKKKDFPGESRDVAIAFSINDLGYYGLGDEVSKKDFWMYDPSSDTWFKMKDFPGSARNGAVSVSLNGKGYLTTGGGFDGKWIPYNDLWEYTPFADSWSRLPDLPGKGRSNATGFTLNNRVYIGCGGTGTGERLGDFWEYDPVTQEWRMIASIPVGRLLSFSFTIGDKAYVGGGYEDLNYINSVWRLDDLK